MLPHGMPPLPHLTSASTSPHLTSTKIIWILFAEKQFRCVEFSKVVSAQEKLLTIWCAAHRVDLVAKGFESVEKIGPILRMLRRLVNHVKMSTGAQAAMAALHTAMCEDEKACPKKLSFAPQRFISHHACATALVKSFKAIGSYIHSSSNGPESDQHTSWTPQLSNQLVGGLEHVFLCIQLGISSSQLTFSPFFRGVGLNHQPVK